MPLPDDIDVTTPKYLRDKYAIVGVGETPYTRGSGKTTRAMGTFALRAAIADAAGAAGAAAAGLQGRAGGDAGLLHASPCRRR